MSQITKKEVLEKKRIRYANAGKEHKKKILDELVDLFGFHRKSAIRAMRVKQKSLGFHVRGRPKSYEGEKLLKPLKTIWFNAFQPCSIRLKAGFKFWIPAYEQEYQKLDADVRESLLSASRSTLDRLLKPIRIEHRRRGRTRPGTLLRQEIPIRTEWVENQAGYLEMDTVALCGGSLDDRHGWMFDAVDIHTTWNVLRALPNRGAEATLEQIQDMELRLPFSLCGLDSDNGGEFINHHLLRHCHGRPIPLAFTRSRAYKKNDNAHVEQKNFTQVRQWFGYERYENPEVFPLMNNLCRKELHEFLNYFMPSMKLESKERVGSKILRRYGEIQTPLCRVLKCQEVKEKTKQELKNQRAQLNPFALRREIDRQLKIIDKTRMA